MAPDDDDADDWRVAGPPLPPDDRLWRHPSELREHGVGGAAVDAPPAPPRGTAGGSWPHLLLAALTGAVLATGALVAVGAVGTRVVERPVVQKVAVTPVVSSPAIGGDGGVDALVKRLAPTIAHLEVTRADGTTATGSAVIYRDDGLLLTSAEVVRRASDIEVELADGQRLPGRLVGADELTDVAVVAIDAEDLPVALLGSSAKLDVGAPTVAIGAAADAGEGPVVSLGVISGLQRWIETSDGRSLHGMIQTDTALGHSAHGGALVDASGALIGIAAAAADGDGGRYCFATPIDLVRAVAGHLIDEGHMAHGWLGVEGMDLTAAEANALGVAGGARVDDVTPGSPAAAEGLRVGDVITELGPAEITSISDLVLALRDHRPGDHVAVGYWREGTHREAELTLGTLPSR